MLQQRLTREFRKKFKIHKIDLIENSEWKLRKNQNFDLIASINRKFSLYQTIMKILWKSLEPSLYLIIKIFWVIMFIGNFMIMKLSTCKTIDRFGRS